MGLVTSGLVRPKLFPCIPPFLFRPAGFRSAERISHSTDPTLVSGETLVFGTRQKSARDFRFPHLARFSLFDGFYVIPFPLIVALFLIEELVARVAAVFTWLRTHEQSEFRGCHRDVHRAPDDAALHISCVFGPAVRTCWQFCVLEAKYGLLRDSNKMICYSAVLGYNVFTPRFSEVNAWLSRFLMTNSGQ